MSHKKPSSAATGCRLPLSTLLTACTVLVLLPLAAYLGREWLVLSHKSTQLDTELAELASRNVVLQRASEDLQASKFQICNKSKDALSVPWLAAVYSDGARLRLFDPLRCQGWRGEEMAAGETRVLHFSSAEDEACNWNGSVVFYAMRVVRQSEDSPVAYNVAGPWRGFERDCFTLE